MPETQPGDVILVAGIHWDHGLGAGLLDAAIQWATDSPFHHAALVGHGVLIQALDTVGTAPLDTYTADGWLYRVDATADQRAAAIAAATRRLGTPYPASVLLDDAARDLLHLPIWARLTASRLTCSGLVAWAYRAAGVRLTWAPLPSPADLSFSPRLEGFRPWRSPAV